MTHQIVTVVVIMLLSISGVAQKKNPDPEKMAAHQTEVITKHLELNDSQLEEITKINKKFSEEMSVLMAEDGGMFGKMGRMKKLNAAKESEYEAVLTSEQMKTYKKKVAPELRKEMRQKMGG